MRFVKECIVKLYFMPASLFWLVIHFKSFRAHLFTHYGITALSPFKVTHWHLGNFYFTAQSSGKKIFIKTDFKLGMLQNEILAHALLSKHPVLEKYSNHVVCHEQKWVAFEFISASSLQDVLSKESRSLNTLTLHDQLIEIIDGLFDLGIVHRDLRLANLMVTHDNQLHIIDFFFAISLNEQHQFIKNLPDFMLRNFFVRRIGHTSAPLVWDDAYSLHYSLKKMNIDQAFDSTLNALSARIGRLVYKPS